MKRVFCVISFILALICAFSSCNQSSSISTETTAITSGETTSEATTPEETVSEITLPEKNTVYVEKIKCDSITLLRETPIVVEKYKEPEDYEPVEFRFDFIQAPEGTSYTTDPESLANNPNRVRINYELLPEGVSNPEVVFEYEDKNYVFFDGETDTFVFLRKHRSIIVTIKAPDGSNVATEIKILTK